LEGATWRKPESFFEMMNGVMQADFQRKLELVVQTGLLLTRSFDLESIVQAATDAGLQLCGAQFGAFFYNVVNATGESYVLYTLSGVEREKFSKFPMPRNTAVFAPTFEGTGIVRSGDITQDARYGKNAPHHGMPKGHLPVRSYLAVPVKAQNGEVLGGLFYGHEKTDVFEQDAEDLVAAVAAQAAVAIESARLRDQSAYQIAQLEQARALQDDVAKRLGQLAAIVESSDDVILSKDLNGIVRSWNKAAERLFGYTAEEMVGVSILKLIPEHLHSDEDRILSTIRAGESIEHFETVRRTKDGRELQVSLTISPVRDDQGAIIGASKILRDISSRKRMEDSLMQAEKIAATGRMAMTIAHEINNPLEAVSNLLYLARQEMTSPQGIEYLDTTENELMRVSHIAKRTLGYYREHASAKVMNVTEIVEQALAVYGPRCASAQIKLQADLRSKRQIAIRPGEAMQVVSNLIANAFYAMSSGGTLTVVVEDTEQPASGVAITVRDNGVGIPEDVLPRVFEAFFTTRTTVGTGIGLFVSKNFVEEHGGIITIESNTAPETHGTCVRVLLPAITNYAAEPKGQLT
jgi:PAS domain S-box-containing protein